MPNYYENFNIKTTEEDILATFKNWLKESTSFHDELLKVQKITEEYYKGNQSDMAAVPAYLSNAVENRLFEAIETLVPISTASAHQFLVMPSGENPDSRKKADKHQKVLKRKYEKLEVQKKLEEIVRDLLLYRFGVLKYCWDEMTDDVGVERIDPRLILMPKLRTDPHKLPYKMEIQEYTEEEIKEYFPSVDIDDLTISRDSKDSISIWSRVWSSIVGSGQGRNIYRVYEVWTSEMVCWINENKILEKKSNPYWDWEGELKRERYDAGDGKKKTRKILKIYNHLDRPEDPFIFFTTFNISDSPVGSVSLAEVAIPIQDTINVTKRGIMNNLKQLGNGKVMVDADAMSEEQANNITNEPGQVIYGEGVASAGKVKIEPGAPLPSAHFNNLTHSEAVFDNLMGVHASTRGSANAKTLGQDILSRQQDYTRIDLVTRILNRGVYRLANGLTQLMKMYYTENHVIKILGEAGATEFVNYSRNDIEDGMEIEVKSGQTVQMDEVTLSNQAISLWQQGALDPVTLYQLLKFPYPEKSAERLIMWKSGQLSMDTQAKIAEINASAAAKGGATPPGGSSVKGEKEKPGIESPLNVIARARQELSGSKVGGGQNNAAK